MVYITNIFKSLCNHIPKIPKHFDFICDVKIAYSTCLIFLERILQNSSIQIYYDNIKLEFNTNI